MQNGTRSTWMAALLALTMGAGELVAYQNVVPHAQALLSGSHRSAALTAGRIVARDLSGFLAGRLNAVVGDLALLGVRQTTRLYLLAQHALGVADPAAVPGECSGAHRGCDAAFASEPDVPCVAPGGCRMSRDARLCPPCPACPKGAMEAVAPAAPAPPGRSGA